MRSLFGMNRGPVVSIPVSTKAWLLLVCIALAAPVAGCTPEKARALQALAVQFRIEALAALDLIEDARQRELEPAPRERVEAIREFSEALLGYPGPITPDVIAHAADPYRLERPETDWDRQLAELRTQYATFADMLGELAAGSYFAREAIAESKELVTDLTAQMLAMARVFESNPPMLIQRRAALIAEIERVRTSGLDTEAKLETLSGYLDRWESLVRSEQELGRAIIAQCLRAATIGKQLRRLADEYERLDLDTIASIAATTLDSAGTITGRDTAALQSRMASTLAAIEADPVWGELIDGALARMQNAPRIQMTQSAPEEGVQ